MVDRISSTFCSTAVSLLTSIFSLGHTALALLGFDSMLFTDGAVFSAEHALIKTPTNVLVTTFAIRLFRILNPRYFSVELV